MYRLSRERVLAAAQTKIDEVLTSLAPYLLALTPAKNLTIFALS
jgi:hypothetical protein